MATKKEYKMVDGKMESFNVEVDEHNQVINPEPIVNKSAADIELNILRLKEKELIQRIQTESKISALAFPLTILAWVVIVLVVLNIVAVLLYI